MPHPHSYKLSFTFLTNNLQKINYIKFISERFEDGATIANLF